MVTMAHNTGQKPGYKQTEVGVIPEDWEVKTLGVVCNYQNGTALERYFNNIQGISVISIGNYSIDDQYIDTNSYIDWKFHEKIRNFILCRDELCMILNDKTSKGAIIGRVLLIKEDNKYVLNQRSMRLVPREFISPIYLYYVINSDLLQTKIVSSAKPGTQIYVNTGDILGLDIPIPRSSKEQTAIATALSDVDALIASLDKLIAKKRAIKQATMQQLLTGKRRLPGFSGEWEVRKIGEIADIVSGGTPSTIVPNFWHGDIKWCTPTDITRTRGKYLANTEKYISEAGLKYSSANLLPIGSLLLCSRATIGEVRITSSIVCTNQGFKSLICSKEVNNEFLYYVILTIKPKLIEKAIGSTFLEISKKDTASLEIALPPLEEQQAIATVLADMDAEIVALEQRRDKTRALKQGMMQELLTGKTRLR